MSTTLAIAVTATYGVQLGRVPRFTGNELEFIINYDIKYRMGRQR